MKKNITHIKPILSFEADDNESYYVVQDERLNTYHVFNEEDIRFSHNSTIIDNYNVRILQGTIKEKGTQCYIDVRDSLIHSSVRNAVCIKNGIDVLFPGKIINQYALYGKIFDFNQWVTWIKNSDYWEDAIIHILTKSNNDDEIFV